MAIYTKPNMSFIDTYTNAAKYRDQRTADANKLMMQGVENLVKGGVEGFKWQERKDVLRKRDDLVRELESLKAERDRLMAGGATPNFDLFAMGYNHSIDTGRI